MYTIEIVKLYQLTYQSKIANTSKFRHEFASITKYFDTKEKAETYASEHSKDIKNPVKISEVYAIEEDNGYNMFYKWPLIKYDSSILAEPNCKLFVPKNHVGFPLKPSDKDVQVQIPDKFLQDTSLHKNELMGCSHINSYFGYSTVRHKITPEEHESSSTTFIYEDNDGNICLASKGQAVTLEPEKSHYTEDEFLQSYQFISGNQKANFIARHHEEVAGYIKTSGYMKFLQKLIFLVDNDSNVAEIAKLFDCYISGRNELFAICAMLDEHTGKSPSVPSQLLVDHVDKYWSEHGFPQQKSEMLPSPDNIKPTKSLSTLFCKKLHEIEAMENSHGMAVGAKNT